MMALNFEKSSSDTSLILNLFSPLARSLSSLSIRLFNPDMYIKGL